ncbi:MAG: hypothetical protein FWG11_02505 [Promicromonosporaceae bacterium]|nr:hypothetical protein [Promicromonosporaceae bacterium]
MSSRQQYAGRRRPTAAEVDRGIRRSLVSGGLALGLVLGGGIAFGYWSLNSGTITGPGVLSSGYYDMEVITADGTTWTGASFTIPATEPLATTPLLPGQSVVALIQVNSLSSIDMPVTVTGTFGGTYAASYSVGDIQYGQSTSGNTAPPGSDTCASAMTDGTSISNGGSFTLTPGASAYLCLQVNMNTSAPDPGSAQGTDIATVTFELSSVQPDPGP